MIKETKHRLLQGLTHTLDLPAEVMLDLPRTTLTGSSKILIENHKGILSYQPEHIRVLTAQGETVVRGKRLKIESLFATDVVITGVIHGIELVGLGV
ncbi:MAG: sporulation protein YqfC [Firmicutes bacterium]|nr:sporulation protein YqfC [Bacillota bacterium]